MEYTEQDDPMGADDTGASDMSRISELVTAIQAQLDELRAIVPAAEPVAVEVEGEVEEPAAAAPPAGDMSKELLMKSMKAI